MFLNLTGMLPLPQTGVKYIIPKFIPNGGIGGEGVGVECLSGNCFDGFIVDALVIMAANISFHSRLIVRQEREIICKGTGPFDKLRAGCPGRRSLFARMGLWAPSKRPKSKAAVLGFVV